jgi:predicted nuclease of predicted toxin-antitoxin system
VIWRYPEHTRATIISKDEDFAVRRTMNPTGSIVVWIRLGNSTKQELLRWLSPLFPEILAEIEAGETLIEVI